MDPVIRLLREKCPSDVLDYGFVMQFLGEYSSPRAKLSRLVESGVLIRLRKGLYLFGEPFRRHDIPMEMIANMIYGPSYVSLEWALRFYGMIPERVDEVTSVTFKRKTRYDTPIGRFSYEHCHPNMYPIGTTLLRTDPYTNALIASKEKALIDEVVIRRGKMTSAVEMQKILFEDLRIDEEEAVKLDVAAMQKMNAIHPHSAVTYLIDALERLQ